MQQLAPPPPPYPAPPAASNRWSAGHAGRILLWLVVGTIGLAVGIFAIGLLIGLFQVITGNGTDKAQDTTTATTTLSDIDPGAYIDRREANALALESWNLESGDQQDQECADWSADLERYTEETNATWVVAGYTDDGAITLTDAWLRLVAQECTA